MRYPSVAARAIITVAVATSVIAGAVTAASPALGQTAPAASAGIAATRSTEVAESPSASAGVGPEASGSIPPGAQIDGRVDVGDPVSPRWFTSDGQSLWVHELTGLVRVDMATSAITGQVPMYQEYGYATTGAGAVWQTDYAQDVLLRIDPVADKVVASIPVGLQPEGVAVTEGVGVGGGRARVKRSRGSILRRTRSSRRSRSVLPDRPGRRS